MRGIWVVGTMEARRHLPFLQWRTGIPMFVVSIALALSWPLVAQEGLDPGADLFVAEVVGGSPYEDALAFSTAFRVVHGHGAAFDQGTADLLVVGDRVYHDEGRERSRDAAAVFDRTVQEYIDFVLLDEPDQDAAYPVQVGLYYEPRDIVGPAIATDDETPAGQTTRPTPAATTPSEPTEGEPSEPDAGEVSERSGKAQAPVRPDDIEPPFPIRSLLLTFAFVIPWSFLAQILSGSVLNERLAKRGRLLLSTPWSGATLLMGLALPYTLMALLIAVGVSWYIGAGWVGFLAMLPVLFVLFTSAALVGLLARSQREMTFLLVAITTGLATFLFLPAMFIQVHPIAFASPVAVVSSAIRGIPVDPASFLYSSLPLALAGGAMAFLAVALFREEHLFSPEGLLSKTLDGMQHLVSRRWTLLSAGILVVPFALVLELFVLVVAVMLELQLAFLLFLFGAAAVEELLKGMAAYAHRERLARPRRAWVVGGLIGAGFFLGEKVALLVSLAGFGVLPLGEPALRTFGIGTGILLVAPLFLHMGTTMIMASRARGGKKAIAGAWWAAVLVHVAYNLAIVYGGVVA